MYVPMWLLLLPVAVLVAPFALFFLFRLYCGAMLALFPPADGSILSPLHEEMERGKPSHRWYATPYLPKGSPFWNPPVKAEPPAEPSPGEDS